MNSPFVKRLSILFGILLFMGLCIAPLAYLVEYEPWGVAEIQREEFKEKVTQIRARVAAASDPNQVSPTAVVPEPVHDFGLMDPLTVAKHNFEIFNEGNEALILTGGETSCKCTLIKDATQIVEPGQSGIVSLEWNSGLVREEYSQTAAIRTNDPKMREIQLKVQGKVRAEISFSESEVNFGNLHPDSAGEFELDVYSQLYYGFEIGSIEASPELLSWTVKPLSSAKLEDYEARSGYQLTLSLPTAEIHGATSGILRLRIPKDESLLKPEIDAVVDDDAPRPESETGQDDTNEEEFVREISFRGKVGGLYTFFGKGVRNDTGLDLGILPAGKQHNIKIFFRVRGNRPLNLLELESITPEFMTAEMQPGETKGVYAINIAVPGDAPTHVFNVSGSLGKLKLKTDLVPGGEIVLPINGAVVSK